MDTRWLAQYEPGVRYNIDTAVYASVDALLADSVAKYGSKKAFTHEGYSLSFAELAELAADFAAYLQHKLALKRGDRVALMLPNVLSYPVLLLGVLKAGCVAVNLSPNLKMTDAAYRLIDSGARVLVVADNADSELVRLLANQPIYHVLVAPTQGAPNARVGSPMAWLKQRLIRRPGREMPAGAVMLVQALRRGRRYRPEVTPVETGSCDLAVLQYTEGTTGRPKAAELTHGNLIANMLQADEWVKNTLKPGAETMAVMLPLYHIFSLTINLLLGLRLGSHQILIDNPRDTAAVVKTLSHYPISAFSGIDGLFRALLYQRGFAALDFSTWKITLASGLPIERSTAEAWRQVTGVALTEAYGLTEAGPGVCCIPLHLCLFSGTVGIPVPNTQIQIRNAAGQVLPAGQAGELWVKGPQVMRGYWMHPEETARVLDENDYLATGDVALMDAEGFVFIKGRCRDVIHVNGIPVYPEEVERIVTRLKGVRAAACIGVPDPQTGERVKLFVVRAEPALTSAEVMQHCQASLEAHQLPLVVVFKEKLPQSSIGKLKREALRQTQHRK
ncbi:long-chain acyl-CoA synthetase [Neisseria sp. HSC-16F19]|nr:AMP-binding protein [Neisseria sp. HSC-16F19]MCP2041587.1 long-chain acyl-CoA synthetase [Neisseria sp. HSC-16F19]